MRILPLLFLQLTLTTAHAHADEKLIFLRFQELYPQIQLRIDESDASESAHADYDGQQMSVVVARGLLKSPRLSGDALRMVLCHEVGHMLGGDPRKDPPFEWSGVIAPDGRSYMSAEGQSDFYAARECFLQITIGTKTDLRNQVDSPRLTELCQNSWQDDLKAIDLCIRTAKAGLDFLQITFDFPISFETPDTSVTTHLIRNTYPGRQCRLDTFVHGALKGVDRPKCWYLSDSSF